METRSETDILGRRWYRIDVLKGEDLRSGNPDGRVRRSG